MSGKSSFTIGYATSDQCRASCMAISSSDAGSSKETLLETCNDPIVAGNVLILQKNSKGEITHYHLECFAEIRQRYQFFGAGTDLPGYSELQRQDQKHVKTCLPEIEQAVPAKKRKVMSPDTAEPEDPKMARLNVMGVDQPLPPPTDEEILIDNREINPTVNDFKELSTMYYYVDKTLLVHQILNDKTAMLIRAPPYWGKTTMISMLKYFLQIHTHEKEEKIHADVKSGKPVSNNYKLFEKRKVAAKPETMEHLGKYPVIHLDLSGNPKTCEDALNICRTAVHKSYLEHRYLLECLKPKSGDYKLVAMWCDETKYKTMDWADIQSDVRALSSILYLHWGEKDCIILIEEYDSIILNCLCSEFVSAREFDEIKARMCNLFTFTVKSNDYMERAVLTGITDTVTLYYWSSFNNIQKYRFLDDHKYGPLHGLTDEEVKELLKRKNMSDKYEKVRSYYNGFTTLDGHSIYNMCSIMNYLKTEKFENPWCTTRPILFLNESFHNSQIRTKIYDLMESKTLGVSVRQGVGAHRIEKIKSFVKQPHDNSNVSKDELLSLLFDQGCLSYAGRTNMLKVPNGQLMEHFRFHLREYFLPIIEKHDSERAELTTAFIEIFKFIHSTKDLRSALMTFLEKMNKLLTAVSTGNNDVHKDTVKIVFCRAMEKACSVLNVEQIRDKLPMQTNYCSVFESNNQRIGVLVEFEVNTSVESVKKQIVTRNYIDAFNTVEELKDPPEVLVMGLNINRDEKSLLKWELTYALHKRGDSSSENEMLKESEWNEIKYP